MINLVKKLFKKKEYKSHPIFEITLNKEKIEELIKNNPYYDKYDYYRGFRIYGIEFNYNITYLCTIFDGYIFIFDNTIKHDYHNYDCIPKHLINLFNVKEHDTSIYDDLENEALKYIENNEFHLFINSYEKYFYNKKNKIRYGKI